MLLVVAGSCWWGWSAAAAVSSDLKTVEERSDVTPYAAGVSGPGLQSRVMQDLGRLNAERSARRERSGTRVIYLEKVSFERSAGGVVARGSVVDFAGPRTVNAVIDAFDASKAYVTSSMSSVQTGEGSTSFSVMLTDQDSFETFSVRFLDERMEEVVMRSADMPSPKVPPILLEDAVRASDLDEVASRLVSLGYAAKESALREEAVSTAIVSRFRSDHGLSGPVGVTVGDLLALRAVNSRAPRTADLTAY